MSSISFMRLHKLEISASTWRLYEWGSYDSWVWDHRERAAAAAYPWPRISLDRHIATKKWQTTLHLFRQPVGIADTVVWELHDVQESVEAALVRYARDWQELVDDYLMAESL